MMHVDFYPKEDFTSCKKCIPVVGTDEFGHVMKLQFPDGSMRWCHADDCEPTESTRDRSLDSDVVLHMDSIEALSHEGVYNDASSLWRRLFLSKYSRIGIHLVEDVPESSGQRCLWAAGLVLTRYLEEQWAHADGHFSDCVLGSGKAVLELGAGAGLPSLCAYLAMGAALVVATEQSSCMEYLHQNMAANGLESCSTVMGTTLLGRRRCLDSDATDCGTGRLLLHELDWGSAVQLPRSLAPPTSLEETVEGAETFDLVLGCDVTFNRKLFPVLLRSIRLSLRSHTSRCLLCHDDESAPFTHDVLGELRRVAALNGMLVDVVDIGRTTTSPGDCFWRRGIHIWSLRIADDAT